MIPPKEKPSWNFEEFLKWLAHHPEALEPGLRLVDTPMDLEPDAAPDAYSLDGLGNPCLIVHLRGFEPTTYDRLLGAMARMRSEPEFSRNPLPTSGVPRLLLLAPAFPEEAKERLALLAQAFPLRCFRVQPPASGRRTPRVQMEDLESDFSWEKHLEAWMEEAPRRRTARLLQACRVLSPAIRVRGEHWPLVLQGEQGLVASVHCTSDGAHFSVSGQVAEKAILGLDHDDAVDQAIDFLMRAQEKNGSHAA